MKAIRKLTKRRKSSKLGKVVKLAIPVAGAVAAKTLWDKKGTEVLGKAGEKVLNKTEEVQEKVQKFHDFIQNSIKETEEEIFAEEDIPVQAGEETNGNDEKHTQEPEESMEETDTESEESMEETDTESEEREKENTIH